MIAFDMLSDGLFAAVAAIGFGAISDPPMRAFPVIALLAAVGHALRFALMQWGVDIASASLCASVTIGVGSLLLGGLLGLLGLPSLRFIRALKKKTAEKADSPE